MTGIKYRIISVITARGGSKGLPGKNIIPLGGKPLIAYTVMASLRSRYIDTTVVSTDYESIRQIAIEYGAEAPFLRPAELAIDTASSSDAVQHAVNFYEKNLNELYDIVVVLQPTSPFRTAKHLDEAIEKFLQDSALDSLVSIRRQEYPPWWTFKIEGNKLHAVFEFEKNTNVFNLERQRFPAVYGPNGAIYIAWRRYLAESGSMISPENTGYYIMKEEDSIDIDNKFDLYLAEARLTKEKI